MIRFIHFLLVGCLPFSNCCGQYKIFLNEKGQVLTTVDRYGSTTISSTAHNTQTYLGSPFLTFPVWQKGKIWLDTQGKALACDLAYNVFTNQVQCLFPGDSTAKLVTPERFVINDHEFVRQQNKLLGIDYRLYATVLHDGQTKLLVSQTKRIDPCSPLINGYTITKENSIVGEYKTLSNYYIRKGDAKPEVITLTRNSLLAVLYDQSEKTAARLPDRNLTLSDVAETLAYYDSLTSADWVNKPSFTTGADSAKASSISYANEKAALSKDPVFNQALHFKILYPGDAWTQGIYGRVYAGFEISEQGRIKNISILSPDNGSAGFIESVKKGLEKLPDINPTYSGKYVLPVAFTYTNVKEKTSAHVPINRLPDERLEGRTMLEEFVVPIVVTKPVTTSREVWGYYK